MHGAGHRGSVSLHPRRRADDDEDHRRRMDNRSDATQSYGLCATVLGTCSVNTGDEPLISFCVYPADAGHNYGDIEKEGFPRGALPQRWRAGRDKVSDFTAIKETIMPERSLVTPRSVTKDGHPSLQRIRDAGYDIVVSSPGKQPTEGELLRLVPGCVGYLAGVEKVTAPSFSQPAS